MCRLSYTAVLAICWFASAGLTVEAKTPEGIKSISRSLGLRSQVVVVLSSDGIRWSGKAKEGVLYGTWDGTVERLLMDRSRSGEHATGVRLVVWKDAKQPLPIAYDGMSPWPLESIAERGTQWIVCLGDLDQEVDNQWRSRLWRRPVISVRSYSKSVAADYGLICKHIKGGGDLGALVDVLQGEQSFGTEFSLYAASVIFDMDSTESVEMKQKCIELMFRNDVPPSNTLQLLMPMQDYVLNKVEMPKDEVRMLLDLGLRVLTEAPLGQIAGEELESVLIELLEKHDGLQTMDSSRYDVKKIREALSGRKTNKKDRLLADFEKL